MKMRRALMCMLPDISVNRYDHAIPPHKPVMVPLMQLSSPKCVIMLVRGAGARSKSIKMKKTGSFLIG